MVADEKVLVACHGGGYETVLEGTYGKDRKEYPPSQKLSRGYLLEAAPHYRGIEGDESCLQTSPQAQSPKSGWECLARSVPAQHGIASIAGHREWDSGLEAD